jgi:hypothetical protein
VFGRTPSAATAFLLAFLAAPAPRADVALPVPSTIEPQGTPEPDEIACQSAEWPAIKRAALDYSKGVERRIANAIRQAFRGCALAPLINSSGDGKRWYGVFTDRHEISWKIVFLHEGKRWEVDYAEEQCAED